MITQKQGDVVWAQTETDGIMLVAIQRIQWRQVIGDTVTPKPFDWINLDKPYFASITFVRFEDYRDHWRDWEQDEKDRMSQRNQVISGHPFDVKQAKEVRWRFHKKASRSKVDILYRNPETLESDYWLNNCEQLAEGRWPITFDPDHFPNRLGVPSVDYCHVCGFSGATKVRTIKSKTLCRTGDSFWIAVKWHSNDGM